MLASVINVSNPKGGTGKTITTIGTAYELSKSGKRVLIINFDAHAGDTKAILQVEDSNQKRTITEAIKRHDLSLAVHNIKENLDLIPGDLSLSNLDQYLRKIYPEHPEERNKHLSKLIKPLRHDYDYIFIDVGSSYSILLYNAILASDYIVIALQTQSPSLKSVKKFIPIVKELVQTVDPTIEIKPKLIGILPTQYDKSSSSETRVLDNAREVYEEAMFENPVRFYQRIAKWIDNGIADNPNDEWNKKALKLYRSFGEEMIERIRIIEEENINLLEKYASESTRPVKTSVDMPKKSILVPGDLHYRLKYAATEYGMYIPEIIDESFSLWIQRKKDE